MRKIQFNVSIIALIVGTFFGGSFFAHAEEHCATRVAEATVPIDELIARAPRIVLAKARLMDTQEVSAPLNRGLDLEDAKRRATEGSSSGADRSLPGIRLQAFEVVEDIKGSGPSEIYLATQNTGTASSDEDFGGHDYASFWNDDAVGRASFVDECSFGVDYEGGRTYLLFMGPIHVKGYELIETVDDLWLVHVRERIEASQSQ